MCPLPQVLRASGVSNLSPVDCERPCLGPIGRQSGSGMRNSSKNRKLARSFEKARVERLRESGVGFCDRGHQLLTLGAAASCLAAGRIRGACAGCAPRIIRSTEALDFSALPCPGLEPYGYGYSPRDTCETDNPPYGCDPEPEMYAEVVGQRYSGKRCYPRN